MAETYYCPHDLPRFAEMGKERPELWAKFLDYYNAVFAEGALSVREKALIALADVADAVPVGIDGTGQHAYPAKALRARILADLEAAAGPVAGSS